MSKKIRFKGIVATLAQIAADAFAGRISWASDLARPVHYYTDSDFAVLARKDVAETFPEVKITNQAGPVARMVQAGTDGTQSAVSAETARSTIDVSGAERINRRLKLSGNNIYHKIATLTVSSQYGHASFLAELYCYGGEAYAKNRGSLLIYARLKQQFEMSSPITFKQVEFLVRGPCPYSIFYTVDQDDASAKTISVWAALSANDNASYTVLGSSGAITFYNNTTGVGTYPDGAITATYLDISIGSLKVTGQAGTVARMVQAGTDGTQSAVSAETARATIGAVKTPVVWRQSAIVGSGVSTETTWTTIAVNMDYPIDFWYYTGGGACTLRIYNEVKSASTLIYTASLPASNALYHMRIVFDSVGALAEIGDTRVILTRHDFVNFSGTFIITAQGSGGVGEYLVPRNLTYTAA